MLSLLRRLMATPGGEPGIVAAAPQLPMREVLRRFWPTLARTAAGCG
jgi:hypothetical protein